MSAFEYFNLTLDGLWRGEWGTRNTCEVKADGEKLTPGEIEKMLA